MKRSDLFIRLMTGVIFLAVALYAGVIIYDSITNPYETAVAINLSIEETFPSQGYIVRTETVLPDISAAVLPIVKEGEKVASGQAVAIEYLNREALENASEVRSLTLMIAGLEASGDNNEQNKRASIVNLSAAVKTGDFRRLDEIALDIETGIFNAETDVNILRNRLSGLLDESIDTRTVYTPAAGYFSHLVDGFEHITPAVVSDLIPSDLHAHFRTPLDVSAAGKLITGFRWYYVAEMNYEQAIRLIAGEKKTIQFSGAYQGQIPMQIENIGRRSGDSCVVVFSSTQGIHEITSVRALSADVINDVYSGIRVPKEAVRLENRGSEVIECVYLQTSGYAERVEIERIPAGNPFETSDSYLVRDGAETGSPLRAGSIIIVKANDLYPGKVVG